jgi:translation elongation factor P/translation initiation factor 5A
VKRIVVFLALAVLVCADGMAQKRNKQLTIEVTSVAGDDLTGQALTLMQTDYEVSYGLLKLDADGLCTVKVYGGPHRLTIDRDGFEPLQHEFVIDETATEATVSVTLQEKTRQPYALTATVVHDARTGRNDIELTWNTEQPAFFDDFESYEPWAVNFGQWTGIDADGEAAAPLLGSYPNRGVMQYAQIINPLTVEPTWWYDYPILRPYDGQQYVGFTRTSSGNANDDWLISPAVAVGMENVLQFMGKAADQFPERFMVYVAEIPEGQDDTWQPTQADFTRIDTDNFETADYRGWHLYSYDLGAYAGKRIKFAIRYISHYNYYGSFMLMVDNVYVGQANGREKGRVKSEKFAAAILSAEGTPEGNSSLFTLPSSLNSPSNPNELFRIFLDGEQVGDTQSYGYTISGVSGGHHTVGVQAVYLQAESAVTTVEVDVEDEQFSHVTFHVTTNSILNADGQELQLLNMETAETFTLTVANGQADILSLPNGTYTVSVAEGAFEALQQTVTVTGDGSFDIELTDRILAPYNMTADQDGDKLTLRWNQELIFSDSFEDYDDFATGSFGEWLTYDMDQQPVYPIALGSQTNIVSFPGSGTATNPTAIAPMVFNPWKTVPAMLPTDPAIAAPTGDKSIIFFSPQRVKADKWLVSPLLDIREGYQLTVTAKGYTSMYPESMEFCVSDGGSHPDDFTPLSKIDRLAAEEWTIYATDLDNYAGETIRLAVHYTSTDAFLAQVDDFTVGPENGQGEIIDYGNVVRYDIFLDGVKIGETTTPTFVIDGLPAGHHVVAVQAVYKNGVSELATYEIGGTVGIAAVQHLPTASDGEVYDLTGRRVGKSSIFNVQSSMSKRGVFIVKKDGKMQKCFK